MDEVIDRVITNENRGNQQIRQYSPLVETYIQNLKPDKELGYVPAGDKDFLVRAAFCKSGTLVAYTAVMSAGKNIVASLVKRVSVTRQCLFDGVFHVRFIAT